MLKKNKKEFIKNKLKNSIKIKKLLKSIILKSIIQNNNVMNSTRSFFLLKYKLGLTNKTTLSDICLNSGVYKKSSEQTNFSRHEFHKLCRTNKLTGWITHSW